MAVRKPKKITKVKKSPKQVEVDIPGAATLCDACTLIHDVAVLQEDILMNEHQHEQLQMSLNDIHAKLDSIQNIRVNGRIGLQESLQDIYLATVSLRSKNSFKTALDGWLHNTTFGKILSTRFGKLFGGTAGAWILLSSLYTLGMLPYHPAEIIMNVFNFITKLL